MTNINKTFLAIEFYIQPSSATLPNVICRKQKQKNNEKRTPGITAKNYK